MEFTLPPRKSEMAESLPPVPPFRVACAYFVGYVCAMSFNGQSRQAAKAFVLVDRPVLLPLIGVQALSNLVRSVSKGKGGEVVFYDGLGGCS